MKIIVTTQSLKFNNEQQDFDVSHFQTFAYKTTPRHGNADKLVNQFIDQIDRFLEDDQEIMSIELYKSEL